MGVYLNPVVQMSGGILLGSYGDLAQRQINSLGKYQQNDHRQTEYRRGGNIKDVQDASLGLRDLV